MSRLPGRIDHLVYATPDLERTVEELASRFGVRPAPGGQHTTEGTGNALLALGPRCYLEVIGPDPRLPAPSRPRWFGIDGLQAPRLVAWAVPDTRLDERAAAAAYAGFPLGPVETGSRQRPDGEPIAWRFTHPRVLSAGGVVPFFIDWGRSRHPAEHAPGGVRLVELRAEHPEPGRVGDLLRALEVDAPVAKGRLPLLVATLDTPRGPAELR